jgi:hypothetical protein
MIHAGRQFLIRLSFVNLALYLIFVSLSATLIAGVVGFLFIAVATLPLSLFAVVLWPAVVYFLILGVLFAAPVTLVLLPATAFIGRKRPLALYFVLPIVGAFGGFLAMEYWASFEMGFSAGPGESATRDLFKWAGLIAGFAAGGVFSAAVREMRR